MMLSLMLLAVLLTLALSFPWASSSPPRVTPLGPPSLGVLEGLSSRAGYENPANRADGFGSWLGWRPQVVHTSLDFNHFSPYPSWFFDPFNVNSTEATISMALPTMFSSSELNTSWAAAAAGEYDDNWRQTADSICNLYHKCDLLIRPAWEMNGNWYPWSAAENLTAYITYFRRVVDAVRSVNNSQFRIVWNPAALYQHGQPDCLNPPWLAYPGDDYVDVIGLDLYDQDWAVYKPGWQQGLNETQLQRVWQQQWTAYQSGQYGLDDVLAFALQHKKQLAVCEWGLKPTDDHGGGDNTIFMAGMYGWLSSGRVFPHLLYQAYYDSEDSFISGSPLNVDKTAFPKAAALYKRLFGPENAFWLGSSSQQQ